MNRDTPKGSLLVGGPFTVLTTWAPKPPTPVRQRIKDWTGLKTFDAVVLAKRRTAF